MFSAGISADLEFRVDRSKRYNFYRDRRKQGDFAETVENATKQGDRINPALGQGNENHSFPSGTFSKTMREIFIIHYFKNSLF